MVEQVQSTTQDIIAVAEFRSALRHFLRRSEKIARQSGLTPQRYTLLMMIKGAADGSEQSTVTELSERLQLATDPHPLARFRVDGVVSDLPEFARAFGCKAGDPMVRPEGERCQIW